MSTARQEQKTGRGAWSHLVISTVTSVALACLAALGATAFRAWKDGNWDGIAILAISARGERIQETKGPRVPENRDQGRSRTYESASLTLLTIATALLAAMLFVAGRSRGTCCRG